MRGSLGRPLTFLKPASHTIRKLRGEVATDGAPPDPPRLEFSRARSGRNALDAFAIGPLGEDIDGPAPPILERIPKLGERGPPPVEAGLPHAEQSRPRGPPPRRPKGPAPRPRPPRANPPPRPLGKARARPSGLSAVSEANLEQTLIRRGLITRRGTRAHCKAQRAQKLSAAGGEAKGLLEVMIAAKALTSPCRRSRFVCPRRRQRRRQEVRHQIPGYQILERLGKGSMGIVYKAKQTSVDRDGGRQGPAGHAGKEQRIRQVASSARRPSPPG